MPSPYPGMDPYLEGSLWTTVHSQLAAEIARQLAPKLRPKYLALTTERFVFDEPEDVAITSASLYPDVGVAVRAETGRAGQATAIAPAPMELETAIPAAIPLVSVEIRDTSHRQLVTAIELLSPTNKRGEGYQEYLARRRRILLSSAHLMEIDLLRQGRRVPMQAPLPAADYFVILTRADRRPMSEIWPLTVRDKLPTVPVPLLPGDVDVPLDLQLAFTTVYDLVGYDLAVDYDRPPEVPLPGDQVP